MNWNVLSMSALRFMLLPLALVGAVATGHAETAVPDYGRPEYWTQVSALPGGALAPATNPQVDVFWIHPTTTRSASTLNHDPLDPAVMRWTDESAVQRQASAFSGCCRIFAPRYRAATSGVLASPAVRERAFALAYSDIERAFDWYLAHENKGRPFILAGHSQGAAHVASLIEKRIQGTKLQQRLVAGYIVGINLMEGEFGPRFKGISPCLRPAQTGCIIQWNAVLAGSDLGPMNAAYGKAFADRYGNIPAGKSLCINPVTFDAARPQSLSAQSKGTVPGDPGLGPMEDLRAGAVAVECRDGFAVVWPAPGLDLKPLPGGSMHYHDVGLFWADIRANAVLRAAAWRQAHQSRHVKGLQ